MKHIEINTNNKLFSIATFMLLVCLSTALQAQLCADLGNGSEGLPSYSGSPASTSNPIYIQYNIHVLGRNDGSGRTDFEDIEDMIAQLNTDYNPLGIYFPSPDRCPIHYINSTYFYDLSYHDGTTFNSTNINELITEYQKPGIDFFIHGPTQFNHGARLGTGILMGGVRDNQLIISSRGASHEVGHLFGLAGHTHGPTNDCDLTNTNRFIKLPNYFPEETGWSLQIIAECVDPELCECAGCTKYYFTGWDVNEPPLCWDYPTENGETEAFKCSCAIPYVGDGFCDTPADPNLCGRVNSSTCEYLYLNDNSIVDKNGDTYDPDTENIISYTPLQCMAHFSDEQIAKIQSVSPGYAFNPATPADITINALRG